MKTYSQSTVTPPPTPPTPPTPPIHSVGGSQEVSVAKSATEDSFAFVYTFTSDQQENLINLIKSQFDDYSNSYLQKEFIKKIEGEFQYKIELHSGELKMEYKFDNPKKEDRLKIIKKFDRIQQGISKL